MVEQPDPTPESLVDDLRRMGKQLAPGYICAPTSVNLVTKGGEERLDWGFDIGRPSDPIDLGKDQWRRVRTPRDLLQCFLKLADAPAKRIERFAKRYGVLGVCEDHGLPISHQEGCQPLGFPLDSHELLSSWREMSRRLGAVSRIATELSTDRLGADSDWWFLRPHFEKNRPFSNMYVNKKLRNWQALKHREALSRARSYLGMEVDKLLELGDVHLGLEWQPASRLGGVGQPARWVLRFRYGHWLNLFGALVVQLLLELGESEDVYICSGCGRSYSRDERRPNSNDRNWCPACRDAGKPMLEADRRRREKKRTARELHRQGVPLDKIAERLNTKPENVSRWLQPRKRVRKS